jgi:hypothetical protein
MKKLLFFVSLMLVLTLTSFSQFSVSTTCNWNDAALRIKPNVDSACIIKVPINAPITVIEKTNDLYFKVKYKENIGYMKISCILHDIKNHYVDKNGVTVLDDRKLFENLPDMSKLGLTDDNMDDAIRLYGNEDQRSQFKTVDGYNAITLIWHCADGKYRSITYTIGTSASYSYYKKDSEYVSDCIK